MKTKQIQSSFADELSSSLTHAVGGPLGIAALVLLVVFAVQSETQVAWKVVGGTIFASSVILLYTVSSVYHALTNERAKRIFQILDHMAIYFLIAGTYTPFCLVTLRSNYPVAGWTLFGILWGLTLFGVVFKLFATGKLKSVSTVTYIVMGWSALLIFKPLWHSLPLTGIVWLIVGGVVYTLGTLFYMWRIAPFHHAIWHLFVLGGTFCHFFCILHYVMH